MICKLGDIPRITFALSQLAKEIEWSLNHKNYLEKQRRSKSK